MQICLNPHMNFPVGKAELDLAALSSALPKLLATQ